MQVNNPLASSQHRLSQPQQFSKPEEPQQIREVRSVASDGEQNEPKNPQNNEDQAHSMTLKKMKMRRRRKIGIVLSSLKNNQQNREQQPQTIKSILVDEIIPQIAEQHENPELKSNQKQCSFCAQYYPDQSLSKSFQCGHIYCNSCLKIYFENQIKNHKIIECPYEQCKAEVNQGSQIFKNMPRLMIDNYNLVKFRKRIEMNPKLTLCPDENCKKGYIQIKDGENIGECKQCKKVYCIKCRMKNHSGKCQSFQEILLKDKFKYKQCFGCKNVVERNSGCPHMTCKCGSQFCYYCGGKWSVPHRCLRYLAGGQLITDKLNNGLRCMRLEDYEYEYTLLGFIVKIPYFLISMIIMAVYVSWSLAILAILITVILVCSLFSGYIALQYKLCKEGNTIGLIAFFVLLVLLPLGIVIGWIAIFCVCLANSFPKYLELALSGRLFPCLYFC